MQWRHHLGKIVLDLIWRHMSKTIKNHQKLDLTITFFSAPNSCKTTLTLLYNKLIFILVSISIFPKTHTQIITDYVWRHTIIMPLDGSSVVSVTQWSIVTNFNCVRFLLSRLSSTLCIAVLLVWYICLSTDAMIADTLPSIQIHGQAIIPIWNT